MYSAGAKLRAKFGTGEANAESEVYDESGGDGKWYVDRCAGRCAAGGGGAASDTTVFSSRIRLRDFSPALIFLASVPVSTISTSRMTPSTATDMYKTYCAADPELPLSLSTPSS